METGGMLLRAPLCFVLVFSLSLPAAVARATSASMHKPVIIIR